IAVSALPRRHVRAAPARQGDCPRLPPRPISGCGALRPAAAPSDAAGKAKELPMVEVIERETVGETIEANVNYVLDNGEKLFTQTATPGATDTRTGGTLDPHRVTIHNARRSTEPFALD